MGRIRAIRRMGVCKMSILIKGMKMPKDCPMCPCAHWNKIDKLTGCELVWRYVPDSEIDYWQSDKRPDWCPLIEVPTPHGRIIDADEFRKVVDGLPSCYNGFSDAYDKSCIIGLIDEMPTIIEAEDGEKRWRD